jgi:hypothetical protein
MLVRDGAGMEVCVGMGVTGGHVGSGTERMRETAGMGVGVTGVHVCSRVGRRETAGRGVGERV